MPDQTVGLDEGRMLLAQETVSERFRRERIKALLEKMADGTLDVGRPLARDEAKTFNSAQISLLLDIVGGIHSSEELAEKYGYSAATIRNYGNHPYRKILEAELTALRAETMLDPMLRIKGLAHEMIDTKVELIRDKETSRVLRNHIATDLLDRAGLTAPKKSEQKVEHAFHLPASFAARLAAGLEESNELPAAPYDKFLQSPSTLLQGEVSSASENLAPSSGQTKESIGASPGAPVAAAR